MIPLKDKNRNIPKEPYISPEVLAYLDFLFPDNLKAAEQVGLDRARGRRDVIEKLVELSKKQQG